MAYNESRAIFLNKTLADERVYGLRLLSVLESVVQIESRYFSDKDVKVTEDLIVFGIGESFTSLDKENVTSKTILKTILKESKLLGVKVSRIDFLVDTFKIVKNLEIEYDTLKKHGGMHSDSISYLERTVLKTYTRLRSVLGSKILKDDLLRSLTLSYSPDEARLIYSSVNSDYFYPPSFDWMYGEDLDKVTSSIKQIRFNSKKSSIDLSTFLLTEEIVEAEFLEIYSRIPTTSMEEVNEEIRFLKKLLRKNHVTTLAIQKSFVKSLRLLLSENPKEIKPKTVRTKTSKNEQESTVVEDSEYEDDSEYEYEESEYEDEGSEHKYSADDEYSRG